MDFMEDWKNVDPEKATDIRELETCGKRSMKDLHPPFLVKVGDYIVKIEYSDCRETLNDRMEQYISRMFGK